MKTAFLCDQSSKSTARSEQEFAALMSLGVDVMPLQLSTDRGEGTSPAMAQRVVEGTAGALKVAMAALVSPWRFALGLHLARSIPDADGANGKDISGMMLEACSLLEASQRDGLAHVHAYGIRGGAIAMLCRELGGPTFSVVLEGGDADASRSATLREIIRRAAFVVCSSERDRTGLLGAGMSLSPRQVHVVPASVEQALVDTPVEPVPNAPKLVCALHGCDDDRPALVLEALASLRAKGIAARLTVVVDGPIPAALRELASELRVASAVSFVADVKLDTIEGRQELLAHIDAARVFINLSPTDGGFSHAAAVAMARARPIIWIRGVTVGYEEVVDDKLGFVVKDGSRVELVKAMTKAVRAPRVSLTRMGEAGRSRVRVRYDGPTNAAKLYSLIFQHSDHVFLDNDSEVEENLDEDEHVWLGAAE